MRFLGNLVYLASEHHPFPVPFRFIDNHSLFQRFMTIRECNRSANIKKQQNRSAEVDYFGFSSDAFEDEYQAIHFRVDLLSDFEKDFQQYLLANCGDAVLGKIVTYNNIRHILNASSRIISFNYTSTIETAYGVTNVDHIHGSVDTSIAIGSGALDEAKESLVDDEYPTIDKFGRDKYGLQGRDGKYTKKTGFPVYNGSKRRDLPVRFHMLIVVASNASVIQMRNAIHSAFTERMVFCLLRRCPKPR